MSTKTNLPKEPTEVEFRYVKSPMYRVVHVDGVWGGVTPSGEIHMALFSERQITPTMVRHKVQGGRLGDPLEVESLPTFERELEVDVRLNLRKAILLHTWLIGKIEALQKAPQETKADGS